MDDSVKGVISLIASVRDRSNAFIYRRLADYGVTDIAPAHGAVFYCLFEGNELNMGEIAIMIHRDKSTVTTLVDKLVALGYAEKRKGIADARVTHVRLTKQGQNLKPVFDEISDELLETVYERFSPEEMYMVTRLLQRMIDNFQGKGSGDRHR